MEYTYKKSRFRPRKPVRSFRDLEVYQKALEGAVMIMKNILPILKEVDYPLRDGMIQCSLGIPLLIAEAHSARFDSKPSGLELLNKSMASCNRMIVYLEQIRDIYSDKIERILIEELIKKYFYNRQKIFHLYKAWEKFGERDKK